MVLSHIFSITYLLSFVNHYHNIFEGGMDMQQANEALRQRMREKRVPAWAIAEALGVCENTVLRHLRRPLPEDELARMLTALDQIEAARHTREEDADGEGA